MFFCICVMMLTACGKTEVPTKVDKNTISVDQDGTVHSNLVGDFEKAYYDVPELTKMAMEEASEYNDAYSSSEKAAVVVDKVEKSEDGSKIYVNYTFENGEVFSNFAKEYYNGGMLFYGTVKEASAAGYRMSAVALTNVKDKSMTTGSAVENNVADKHILITDQQGFIYCPYKVSYVGEGAVWMEEGIVDTTNATDKVFILMEK